MALLPEVTCPWCWRKFASWDVLFIAESVHLRGDAISGALEGVRFEAMRFDASGHALDPDGARCSRIACPHCHGELPRALLELPHLPVSIVGAQQSGKTNLLAAGLWKMAQNASRWGLVWTDADPRFNEVLHRNESMLFGVEQGDTIVTLPKTDVSGNDLYREVTIHGVVEIAPRPSFFIVGDQGSSRQMLVELFDNAGEHFVPDHRSSRYEASTRHLQHSLALLVSFDPLQHVAFRQRHAPQHSVVGARHQRQDVVFSEMVARVRRMRGLSPSAPITLPVIVALTKADVWGAQALGDVWNDHTVLDRGETVPFCEVIALAERVSGCAKQMLSEVAPEFVHAVDNLASKAWFLPVSALGSSPQLIDGVSALQASMVRPRWAELPFAVVLHECRTVGVNQSQGAAAELV